MRAFLPVSLRSRRPAAQCAAVWQHLRKNSADITKRGLATGLASLLVSGLMIDPQVVSARQGVGTPVTPIQHVVVIFGENESFDHYFGTYPNAANPVGEPHFTAATNTPTVNGLSGALLTNNPNYLNTTANTTGASNPFRLDRSQALTADQNHSYMPEQLAYDNGLMDMFPVRTGSAGNTPGYYPPVINTKGLVMGYFDGNTVTAMWNYAQHFALNDNSFTSQFGPSTPGAINLISGQTDGITIETNAPTSAVISDGNGGLTLINDADPYADVCSTSTGSTIRFGGTNIGDLLNQAGVSWGWFQGGFNLQTVNANGSTGCTRSTVSPITGLTENDYVQHHQPFQYYASTANPAHTRPTSVSMIGKQGDAANHEYDVNDFYSAVQAGNFPAVSFLKAASYQDAHPGNSNPLDEQAFVVGVVNFLQQQGVWANTAVVLAYDDSDGWYDHQLGPIVNTSATTTDALTGTGSCGTGTAALPGIASTNLHSQGRCGYGTRMPMLVISPYAKPNFVDHTVTDQTSIIRFVEDNWLGGERIGGGSFDGYANSIATMFNFTQTPNAGLILSPTTGLPQ